MKKRVKNKDSARRAKKKISILTSEKVAFVDYKDVNLMKRCVSDRAKIRARRVTGNNTQQQATIANAVKNAREMALIPYVTKVTTQRGGRDRGERGDRGDRGDRSGPPPVPSSPPPGRDAGGDDTVADELDATLVEVEVEVAVEATGGEDS